MSSGHADTYPRLVGDIGGTNARFAMVLTPGAAITHIRTLPCADYPGIAEAMEAYLKLEAVPAPKNAAMGIANPVTGDAISLTNNDWAFSTEAVRQRLGLERLTFVNDFTALALSLPYLSSTEKRQVGRGAAVEGAAIGVIGPGTGLGVSGLIPQKGRYSALEGEGGHVTLSAQTEEEFAVIAAILKTHSHCSAERVLSGPGLKTLYRALAEVRGIQARNIDSPEISSLGVSKQDALCTDTLNMFCALLGSEAGNLALTLGALGGIFIGGGIVPRFGDFFEASPFRRRFEAKGRFSSYLEKIPTYVITAAYPALTGAAAAMTGLID
ncbi:glucokinase [Uliginosibacterium gangwonense]|uniref:glucokinase n=1 Tax=Uliginosibacterium gangwonense TaxID=392736 RepID=UPI0003727D59|nr:glucokinase [Uliginosibacterium gangwonense]